MKKQLRNLMLIASLVPTLALAKGIDIEVTGQTVLYYETNQDNGTGGAFDSGDMFSKDASEFQFGLQLGLGAYLGNGFNFQSAIQYKGTSGLDQTIGTERQAITSKSTTKNIADEIALSQIYLSKKFGNTLVKIGRQELSRAYYPFTYTEGWNVFKNSFEAFTVINTDIKDTTIVVASIGKSNNVAPFDTTTFAALKTTQETNGNMNNGARNATGVAYMATIVNKSIPMTKVSVTAYSMEGVANTASTGNNMGVQAYWAAANISDKDLPMGLNIGLQGGLITTNGNDTGMADTSALGTKVSLKPFPKATVSLAFTSVSGDDNKKNIAFKNFGTGIKTPLFTQMVYNQDNIALDSNTFVAKLVYSLGTSGTIITQYGMTSAGKSNIAGGSDYNEFDLMYKVKTTGGINCFIAYVNRDWDKRSTGALNAHGYLLTSYDTNVDHRIRMWARYNF
ncbi:hypothetical protein MNB_SM-4-326 [hydrothermal vent metagenome]|uniref:Outer membrane porin n=1 Tax=hydrothermal vent metagenome TaxID=652676 RepID=A0A1W1BKV8_9ZZZZ